MNADPGDAAGIKYCQLDFKFNERKLAGGNTNAWFH